MMQCLPRHASSSETLKSFHVQTTFQAFYETAHASGWTASAFAPPLSIYANAPETPILTILPGIFKPMRVTTDLAHRPQIGTKLSENDDESKVASHAIGPRSTRIGDFRRCIPDCGLVRVVEF
jgi:hypothetical protein